MRESNPSRLCGSLSLYHCARGTCMKAPVKQFDGMVKLPTNGRNFGPFLVGNIFWGRDPGGTRTHDLRITSPILIPPIA